MSRGEGTMRRWAVTGPIGAGKSLAVRLLAERGALVVDADAVGHAVLREPDVRDAVALEFGPEILVDGAVDRAAVADRVFGDAVALARLNALTHPRLAERLRERLAAAAAAKPALAVLEAAVYFLLPPVGDFDLVVAVVADEAIRLRRLTAGGRYDAEAARRRIEAQRPLLPLFERADVILVNEGDEDDLARSLEALLRRP